MSDKFIEEGDACTEKDCTGHYIIPPVENCSCHISAPCNACVDNPLQCNECGHEIHYERMNDHVLQAEKRGVGKIIASKLRDLDRSKVDWHSFSHSSRSMIKRGVYPKGMTQEEVRKQVNGTFGGRFNYFEDGKFEFVAYTD